MDPPPGELEQLLAEVLAADDPEAALAAACQAHPEDAERLRRGFGSLRRFDLLRRPPVEPVADARIEGFVLGDTVGSGGMGIVYRARDLALGRDVALKVLRPELLHFAGSRRRFEREIEAVARLRHPGIVTVLSARTDGDVPYFTMELVEGESLAQRIARLTAVPFDRLTPESLRGPRRASGSSSGGTPRARSYVDACVEVTLMIADALQHAHQRGVFHRDVKPSNVLMDTDGRARLLDFGLASVEDAQELTRSTAVLGSLPYMPPERLSGTSSEFGPRQEVYSLGVTLYEMLTLRSPFLGGSAERTKERVLAGDVIAPRRIHPGVPRDLETVCLKAMDAEPDRRYATVQAFADDLGNVLSRRPIVARPAGWALRTRRLIQRHPTAAVAGVLGVLLFVGAPVAFALQQHARAETETGLRTDAERSARLAEEREAEVELTAGRLATRTREFELLKNVVSLRRAAEREASLHPPWPEQTAALRSWLAEDWEPLVMARPSIDATLDELRTRALPVTAESAEDVPPEFADRADQFLYETLARLTVDLDAFESREVESVRARLAWSEDVRELTVGHPNERVSWADVRAAVDIEPQIGLVPIGPNPVTGMWEFYHLRSAADPLVVPEHDPKTGHVTVDEDTGIVFVLLPGGTFWMGSQREDESAPNFDAAALRPEGPPREVTLAPYFLARHELTQAQWMRLGDGRNPSIYHPGRKLTWEGRLSLAHPVENVDWTGCVELCRQNGLTLPTEAQWEFACRADSHTPWWTGADRDSLIGAVNIADQAAARLGSPWAAIAEWPELDDGFPVHAPVAALRANPWGFHNVHGNVWEWTADRAAHYVVPVEQGTGRLMAPEGTRGRVQRGGSCVEGATNTRSAMRNPVPPELRNGYVGMRPARAVR